MLPLILAGPIIREATKDNIKLWVVTSSSLEAHAAANGATVSVAAFVYLKLSDGTTLALGHQFTAQKFVDEKDCSYINPRDAGMHAYVVDIPPYKDSFPEGVYLFWDLCFFDEQVNEGNTYVIEKNLSLLPPLSEETPRMRSFVISPATENSVIWVGSCTRPHGPQKSVFPKMKLKCNLEAPPNHLFQLGDQIYADDVSFILFERVKSLALEIFSGKLSEHEIEVLSLNDEGRRKLLEAIAPAFSQETGVCNQLLIFPEFCAYTLLHLNVDLWGDLNELAKNALKNNPGLSRSRTSEELRRLEVSREHLRDYMDVQQMTVVYSLPDDHEICDDFALDSNWGQKIRSAKSPTERRSASVAGGAICAAMAAYALFQDVGVSSMGKRMLQALKSNSPLSLDMLDNSMDYQWTYIPKVSFPAIALDTRFSRAIKSTYTHYEPSQTTGFVKSSGRFFRVDGHERTELPMDRVEKAPEVRMFRTEELTSALSKINSSRLVLLTPSPIVSAQAFDVIKLRWEAFKLGWSGEDESPVYEVDFEGWKSNISSFANLVHYLVNSGVREVCAFGGDIHFSFFKQSEIRLRQGGISRPLLFSQITTSPMMNGYEKKFGSGTSSFQELLLNFVSRKDEGYTAYVPRFIGERVVTWELHKSESFKTVEPPQYIEEIVANGGLFVNAAKGNDAHCNFCAATVSPDGRLEDFEIFGAG